jgi:hypothetical protein
VTRKNPVLKAPTPTSTWDATGQAGSRPRPGDGELGPQTSEWEGRVDRDTEGRLQLPRPVSTPTTLHVLLARPGRCVLTTRSDAGVPWCKPVMVGSRGRFRLPDLAQRTLGVPLGDPVLCLARLLPDELQVILVDLQRIGLTILTSVHPHHREVATAWCASPQDMPGVDPRARASAPVVQGPGDASEGRWQWMPTTWSR